MAFGVSVAEQVSMFGAGDKVQTNSKFVCMEGRTYSQ